MNPFTRSLRTLKRLLLPRTVGARAVLTGAFRGIRFHIDPARQTQLWLGLYEREVQGWLEQMTRGAAAAVDIGAAEGEYTLYLLLRTDARVIAVEPLAESRQLLRANLALNNVHDTERLEVVTDYLGTTEWTRPQTLDSIVAGLPRPLFVKMDVDGSELDILRSGDGVVSDRQVRWLIETHSPQLERDCLDVFRQAGRHGLIVDNAWWRALLPEERPIEQNRWLVVP